MGEINILINKAKLEKRIEELAKQIDKDYEGKEIVFIGILKGSVMFMTELAKNIKSNVELDFMDVSSYEGTESTGNVKINKDIRSSIEGKDVIIVAQTMIMYADVTRQEKQDDGSFVIGVAARQFTPEVLAYLFEKIAPED